MIAIVDFGMGNLGSIHNMLNRIGAPSTITSDPGEIRRASRLILPGVGAFDLAMRNLRERGLRDVLDELAMEKRVPVLGICLGMQLLTAGSEEGDEPGLGWIDGDTVRFDLDARPDLRLPHMGWNVVQVCRPDSILDGSAEQRFYFVHTYHIRCKDPANVLGISHYGYDFCAAVIRDNIVGTQFHPEKSHSFGMQVLSKFATT